MMISEYCFDLIWENQSNNGNAHDKEGWREANEPKIVSNKPKFVIHVKPLSAIKKMPVYAEATFMVERMQRR